MNEPFNAADRGDVREVEKISRATARTDDDVLRGIMRTPAGRGWMFRRLAVCHLHEVTFVGDALKSAFLEGERNIGLMFQADILRVCPDEFIQMMRESNERSLAHDAARNNRRRAAADEPDLTNFVDYTDTGADEPAS